MLEADYFEVGAVSTKGHAAFHFSTANRVLYFDADGAGSGASVAVAKFDTGFGTNLAALLKHTDVLIA